jgi:hypothetical protein
MTYRFLFGGSPYTLDSSKGRSDGPESKILVVMATFSKAGRLGWWEDGGAR